MERYLDRTLPVSERVEDLLGRMTRKEKAGQLNQRLYGFAAYERDGEEIRLTEETVQEAERCCGLGVVYGLYRADPWSGRTKENGLHGRLAVKAYNLLQRCCLEHSRLGIPMLLSSECPHGHQALDGYLLPVNLAVGATFHPQLLQEAASVCGRQLKQLGVNLALVSALDVLRDPRWGRSEECFGEDPYLGSCFARAAVTGIQEQGVYVVAKHFCAQGEGTGGINASAARIGERELREIHLPPARACCEAGVKGIMAAYNEIDGVYCHMNDHLLTEVLREEYRFEGIVMADGMALNRLRELTGDDVVSCAQAMKAGVDVSLWDGVFPRIEEAAEQGLLPEEVLDEAVRRVLTQKFELGLFEHPYLPEDREPELFSLEQYPQSLQLARESAVLLKNEASLLPLSKKMKKIAVLGPNADDIYRQLGDYTPPVTEGEGITLLDGMRKLADGHEILTCSYGSLTEEKRREVRAVLSEADVIVMAMGGSSSRYQGAVFDDNGAAIQTDTEEMTAGGQEDSCAEQQIERAQEPSMECGEGLDVSSLELPQCQMEWFRLAKQSGKPLAAVVIAGRPYAVNELAEGADALMYCFYPGPAGGRAIAELLYGLESPSGRLPVSIPRSAGQLPVYYNFKKSCDAMRYCDQKEQGSLFAFGEGFGYGTICYEELELVSGLSDAQGGDAQEALTKDVVRVSVTANNKGTHADWAVPQLYLHDIAASTVRRVRELKAFDKRRLLPGESFRFTLSLPREAFAIWNARMEEVVEPGWFELFLMDQGKAWGAWCCRLRE